MKASIPTRTHVICIFTTLMLSLLASCQREDDINEIFIGKTWYMNGGTVNGNRLNADIKNFFVEGAPSAYSITFTNGTFTGLLRPDAPFTGTWTVDGHNHTITLTFKEKPTTHSDFDQHVYNVLKSVRTYESGATFLLLKEGKDNSIMFGTSR